MNTIIVGIVAVVTTGCMVSEDASSRIDVAPNELGVATLQIESSSSDGESGVELRGRSASGDDIAFVRRRIGQITDLPDTFPGDAFGSEVVISVHRDQTRVISREVNTLRMLAVPDPSLQTFVSLREVTSALDRYAHIVFAPARSGTKPEAAYNWESCPAAFLNTSPTAGQCCFTSSPDHLGTEGETFWSWDPAMMFVIPNGNVIVRRPGERYTYFDYNDYAYHSTYLGCTGEFDSNINGYDPCSGRDCVYGPNGFAIAYAITPPSGTPYADILQPGDTYYGDCSGRWLSSPTSHAFPDVTGTFATGQGCPGGDTGAGLWDY